MTEDSTDSAEVQTQSTTSEAASTGGAFDGLIDASGKFTRNWADRLPDDLKSFGPSVATFENFPELIKGYGRLKSRLGKAASATFVPDEGAGEDEIAAYRQAIGAPDSADGYGLARPPEGHEGDYDAEFGARVGEVLHRHRVPQAAAQELLALEMERAAASADDDDAHEQQWMQEQSQKLKKQWGRSYEVRRTEAARAAQAFGLDLGNCDDADIAMAFARIHTVLSEDGTARRALGLDSMALSPIGANPKSRARDIMTNPANPLYQSYTNGDSKIRQMVHGLLRSE